MTSNAGRVHPRPGFAKLEGEALVQRFLDEARASAADVMEIASIEALPQAVTEVLGRLEIAALDFIHSPDPMFAGLAWPECGSSGAVTASLTRAWCGVAETGTLVLASGPDNPTDLVFLPEVHMVALERRRIFAAYEDALAALQRETGRLPRSVNLVTGPSRTGDIGGRIVLGAHGPRRLFVFLIP